MFNPMCLSVCFWVGDVSSALVLYNAIIDKAV